MSDDLHNNWGVNLCLVTKRDQMMYSSQSSELLFDELKRIISLFFNNDFVLHKVMPDGSSANVFSILDATLGDTNRCLVAAGSYLCADYSIFESLTTTEFYLSSSLSVVREPDDDDDVFTCRRIIALPYTIENAVTEANLIAYEDGCFEALHEKLLFYRIMGKPIKAIILELILAGNGASLSNRALSKLALLSVKHDFSFIVDEIMTGGRTGTMLLLLEKPPEFIQCVTHVTLGKWPQAGLILVSKAHDEKGQKKKRNFAPRSASTCIDYKLIIPCWNKVTSLLTRAQVRREVVLKRIKCDYDSAWGVGCLIFIPQKNNTPNGLKNRILPMLELTPIDTTRIIQPTQSSFISKKKVNKQIMYAINKWKDVSIQNPNTTEDDVYYLELVRHLTRHLKQEFGEYDYDSDDPSNIVSTEEMYDLLQKTCQVNFKDTGVMLRKLELAGLVKYRMMKNVVHD
jgi:hypothetical protein